MSGYSLGIVQSRKKDLALKNILSNFQLIHMPQKFLSVYPETTDACYIAELT